LHRHKLRLKLRLNKCFKSFFKKYKNKTKQEKMVKQGKKLDINAIMNELKQKLYDYEVAARKDSQKNKFNSKKTPIAYTNLYNQLSELNSLYLQYREVLPEDYKNGFKSSVDGFTRRWRDQLNEDLDSGRFITQQAKLLAMTSVKEGVDTLMGYKNETAIIGEETKESASGSALALQQTPPRSPLSVMPRTPPKTVPPLRATGSTGEAKAADKERVTRPLTDPSGAARKRRREELERITQRRREELERIREENNQRVKELRESGIKNLADELNKQAWIEQDKAKAQHMWRQEQDPEQDKELATELQKVEIETANTEWQQARDRINRESARKKERENEGVIETKVGRALDFEGDGDGNSDITMNNEVKQEEEEPVVVPPLSPISVPGTVPGTDFAPPAPPAPPAPGPGNVPRPPRVRAPVNAPAFGPAPALAPVSGPPRVPPPGPSGAAGGKPAGPPDAIKPEDRVSTYKNFIIGDGIPGHKSNHGVKFPYRIIYGSAAERFLLTVDFRQYEAFIRMHHPEFARTTTSLNMDKGTLARKSASLIELFGSMIGVNVLVYGPSHNSLKDCSDQYQELLMYSLGHVLNSVVGIRAGLISRRPLNKRVRTEEDIRRLQSALGPDPAVQSDNPSVSDAVAQDYRPAKRARSSYTENPRAFNVPTPQKMQPQVAEMFFI
jgi:hypothetical protein